MLARVADAGRAEYESPVIADDLLALEAEQRDAAPATVALGDNGGHGST
jgi:hypothetical protein